MVKVIWIFLFCVFINIIQISSAPKKPFSKWPSLVPSTPKCPTPPSWKDLKPSLQDLTSKPKTDPKALLQKFLNRDCKDNIVELDAEEIATNVTVTEDRIEVQKKEDERNKKKELKEPVPTLIPIFRPKILHKKQKEDKELVLKFLSQGTSKHGASANYINVNDVAITNNDNSDDNNSADVFKTTPNEVGIQNEGAINTDSEYLVLGYTGPRDPENSVKGSTIARNTISGRTVPENTVIGNTVTGNVVTGTGNTVSGNTDPGNTFSGEKTVLLNEIPNTTSINPNNNSNTDKTPPNITNSKPVAIVPPNSARSSMIPFETISLNPSSKILSPNESPSIKNIPLNTISGNTISGNTIPGNTISNTPSKLIPVNAFNSIVTVPEDCKAASKTAECNKKADLVLFKPEQVSLLNVYGEFLKKVTMTVLVPMYVSKLDL